ncbi:alanine racemase [Clostridium tepidiprofundi DSM 19306]|uniref:Alanine racemase n=1 Tax=Clostridium tepidiprofundi DSM 19306 TaxID=1121338 RepID=A0A151AQZ1_9CLOT|nr:alanine/ornithine racemase family PLP-dependent enzyme [Clostridium tepidiprofundi]KYH30058.1 alanine racemase [Clostridium tepidiprofundi DSM 19306]
MSYPRIKINLSKIKHNTTTMVNRCRERNIYVAGVTKMCSGDPVIAKVLVDSGVNLLADSRVLNLKRLEKFNVPKMLIRIPMKSNVKEIVKYSDICLLSEYELAKSISSEALKQNKKYKVILMVDLGDLREGLYYDEKIYEIAENIIKLKGITLYGIGANLSCYGGVEPTRENLNRLVYIKRQIYRRFNVDIEIISGGASGSTNLFDKDEIPKEINQLRLGVSLFLGLGLNDEPIEGLIYDAFTLEAEIVEVQMKPSKSIGKIGVTAFGEDSYFEDKGKRLRAICAIGGQDVNHIDIRPIDHKCEILGSSSDHLLLDITESDVQYKVCDTIEFNLNYRGSLFAMTSEYIYREYV